MASGHTNASAKEALLDDSQLETTRLSPVVVLLIRLVAFICVACVVAYRLDAFDVQASVGVDAQYLVMVATGLWICFLEFVPCATSEFVARKLCHAGCGLAMLALDSRQLPARIFVWTVAAASISMTWGLSPLPPFRFAKEARDIGVTIYLLIVSLWFALQLPPLVLAPVFFADPAGAVVGKMMSRHAPALNPLWYQRGDIKRSVWGSAAVFLTTLATIFYPCNLCERLGIALLAMIAEAFGGKYDNLALAAAVLVGWLVLGRQSVAQ
eukprot:TRINITY_DN22050_c0_g2_i3.p2 TRINITY_DN22050_c0_g2~~TRINITY_DN22050_c0_g2_i3.p2  ORF type:complete len:280 (-),score=39.85 TRINITY_DN22050_c0_g2_i3:999-1802(-)